MHAPLLLTFVLPLLSLPFIYISKKRPYIAAASIISSCAINLVILLMMVPTVLSEGKYVETYRWIPTLSTPLTLFVDGISLSLAVITLILVISAAAFSVGYIEKEKGSIREYYML
ncbi:MAG TPA: hypothetical protein ENF42_04620, partial [Candidatus Bathyarchaeota archaeon]|nr:hypothetical protein [Candidatus Bathyarchaeota archaeon]